MRKSNGDLGRKAGWIHVGDRKEKGGKKLKQEKEKGRKQSKTPTFVQKATDVN